MQNTVVNIDLDAISDSPTFHAVFAAAFGFPDFYGNNMNAWIDCMSYLDDPSAGMSSVRVLPGHVAVLQLRGVKEFASRCPDQYTALVECSSFVNWRRIEQGGEPVLAIAFCD